MPIPEVVYGTHTSAVVCPTAGCRARTTPPAQALVNHKRPLNKSPKYGFGAAQFSATILRLLSLNRRHALSGNRLSHSYARDLVNHDAVARIRRLRSFHSSS